MHTRLTIAAFTAAFACAACAEKAPVVEGTVVAVDAQHNTITLNHGPIPNVQMPAMQMMFAVPDSRALDSIAAGEKVRFTAEFVNGTLSVTSIAPE